MPNRRPVRKPQQRQRTQPAAPPAPALGEPAWTPPTPLAVARLGSDQQGAYDRVGLAAARLRSARHQLAADVAAARGHGVSWAVIGLALGTTGEAARQRWGSAA